MEIVLVQDHTYLNLGYNSELYNISDTSNASGCWISSPNNFSKDNLFTVTNYSPNSVRLDYAGYKNTEQGIRPVVCLKNTTKIIYDKESKLWNIE